MVEEMINSFTNKLLNVHQGFISAVPGYMGEFTNFIILLMLVFLYSIFIWNIYRFISTKNFLKIDWEKYLGSHNVLGIKMLYFLEYIIISPFVIFFSFVVFGLFLLLMSEGLELQTLLIVTAIVVASIRMTSYYSEDLARDLAKGFPFTLLLLSMTKSNFFNIERIIGQLNQIPLFFSNILIYLVFLIALEIILRFFEFLFSLFGIEEE
jgi:hypothetical protein